MPKIKRVVGIYPSTSGNIRVAIEFHDRGDMNFYMTKNGDLHIGKTHDEHTLDDPREAYNEFLWAQKAWTKGNPDVRTEDLKGDKLKLAVALCLRLQDPIERKKEFQKAMAARRSTSTMKDTPGLNSTLKQIKKNIQKENRGNNAGNQIAQPPAPANKPENAQQPVTNNGDSQKVNSPYGGSQIDKFNKKYRKSA